MSNNALVFATYLADILGLTISANGVCLISKNKDQELSFKLTFRSEMANNKEITGMNRCDSLQQSAYIVKVLFCLFVHNAHWVFVLLSDKEKRLQKMFPLPNNIPQGVHAFTDDEHRGF